MKRNPLGDTQASVTLLESINKLNENISKLVTIFQSANDDFVKAFNDTNIQEQMRKLREENAKIAHGIVAVAELVKEVKQGVGKLPELELPKSMTPPPQQVQQQVQQTPQVQQYAFSQQQGFPQQQQAFPNLQAQPQSPSLDFGERSNPFLNQTPKQRQFISEEEVPPPPPR